MIFTCRRVLTTSKGQVIAAPTVPPTLIENFKNKFKNKWKRQRI